VKHSSPPCRKPASPQILKGAKRKPDALFLRGKPFTSVVKSAEAHPVSFLRLKGESTHGAGSDTTRISAAEIANYRALLMQFEGAHRAERLAGAAACAEFRIDMNLAEGADLHSLCRALRAVTLPAALTDDRIVETPVFDFDDLDAGRAPPHSPRVKKGAADFAPPASGTLGWIEFDHGSPTEFVKRYSVIPHSSTPNLPELPHP
jgi:hypothetical protein